MKAARMDQYGPVQNLKVVEIADPQAGPGQVLVRVKAASVNPVDWKLMSGKFKFFMPITRPYVPGLDIAGEVMAAGSGAKKFQPNDRVYGFMTLKAGGGMAELAAVDESTLNKIPEGVSFAEAASLPIAGLSAYQAMEADKMKAGDKVLVVGAAGGVGHYAVQIAKAAGAHVTAVCGPKSLELARTLGADRVIDYTQTSDFGPEPYDVIMDCVVKFPFSRFKRLLKPAGLFAATLPAPALMFWMGVYKLFSKKRIRIYALSFSPRDFAALTRLAGEQKIKSVVQKTFPLNEAVQAYELSMQGHVQGKLIVQPS